MSFGFSLHKIYTLFLHFSFFQKKNGHFLAGGTPLWWHKSILLTYNDRDRVREHQQAVPPGASEHRDAQPRPEQVLADQGAAPRGPLPQGGRSQRPRAQGRKRLRVGPQGHQL